MTNRRRPAKFGGSAKVTLTALSLMGFIGGWNLIARIEHTQAAPKEPAANPPAAMPPTAALPTPTPWPTVQPLAELPPIPTLVPTLTSGTAGDSAAITIDTTIAPLQIAPLPTLAPLPPMPQAPPPPPPPPPMPAGGWQQSGGS